MPHRADIGRLVVNADGSGMAFAGVHREVAQVIFKRLVALAIDVTLVAVRPAGACLK